jgi:uncharacterized protein DUF3108
VSRVPSLSILPFVCGALLLARGADAQRREQAVPFTAGETLTYDVSWSSYVTAGTATLHVDAKRPSYNSVAYYIVAEGRPTPLVSKLYTLYYKVDTLLDVFTLRPQRASVYSEEGKRHRMKTTMFDQDKPAMHDPLAAMYVLRAIPLKTGDKITMPICDNGTNYKMLIAAGGIEPVKTGAGTIQAQQLTLTPQGADIGARALSLWLSTDAARVPVKMSAQLEVGAFVLTLSSRK